MEAMPSYAKALRKELYHALVKSITVNPKQQSKQETVLRKIEPELPTATTNQGKYKTIHNMKTTPRKTLSKELVQRVYHKDGSNYSND